MPYWDHEKAIGSAGGLFVIPYTPPCTPYGGLRGVPVSIPATTGPGIKRPVNLLNIKYLPKSAMPGGVSNKGAWHKGS